MQFAGRFGLKPTELATALISELTGDPALAEVSLAAPGFLNFRIEKAAAGQVVATIVAADEAWGSGETVRGERINLEFVSANPTGPLHLGGARWAAVGDSLARILESQGARVTREYYFNDHGAQIDRFARSLVAAARGEPAPEDGYGGDYIQEIAARILQETAQDLLALPDAEAQEEFRAAGVSQMFDQIKQELHDFGVDFDVFFHENSLYESGAVTKALSALQDRGHIYESDGATWFKSSELGDDRDRVIIKSDGEAAYIAGDIAYYLDKRARGFDRCVYMLGADHHGYVPRMMALCRALGDIPGENLEVLIGQLVNLVRAGAPVRMSKRAGTVVTMADLVDAVGVDAARYALVRSSINTSVDIELELWSSRTSENPVFYVQYAHARTSQIRKNAAQLGVERGDFEASLLIHPSEGELLASLVQFPEVVASAAELREPHRIARYLEELAGHFHRWYDSCRVLPATTESALEVHSARLWLNDAAAIVLRNGLRLLGISTPERM
jgi:arginyl-tRNA synthetase